MDWNVFPSQVALVVKNLPAQCRRCRFIPGSRRSLGGRHGNPLQYSCLENPTNRGAWWATVHRVAKSWTQLKQLSTHTYKFRNWSPNFQYYLIGDRGFGRQLDEVMRVDRDPMPEKAMAPHSSSLAWKIPWMKEPDGLQSVGSLRVRHDWATSLSLFTFMHWRRKWQPTPVFLPGKSHKQRNLGAYNPWGLKRVRHNWVTKQQQHVRWLGGRGSTELRKVRSLSGQSEAHLEH